MLPGFFKNSTDVQNDWEKDFHLFFVDKERCLLLELTNYHPCQHEETYNTAFLKCSGVFFNVHWSYPLYLIEKEEQNV